MQMPLCPSLSINAWPRLLITMTGPQYGMHLHPSIFTPEYLSLVMTFNFLSEKFFAHKWKDDIEIE